MVQRLIDQKQEWPHQPSLWRHKTTVAFCSSLHQKKGLKALRGYTFLFPSPKALMRLNVNASEKGPQPCWTRKREGKQTLICRTRGTNCSLVWTWVYSQARHQDDNVWQEATAQPSAESSALKEFIHSTWVSNFLPSGYSPMAASITDKIDGSVWRAKSTLVLCFSLKKNLHTQELKLWDKFHLK